MIDYRERFERVRAEMEREGVDYLLVGPSTDLVYLLGYPARQSERLTLFVLPRDGAPRLVMPSFELPRVERIRQLAEPASWTETENPTELLASLLPKRASGKKIAVGGQLYTYFLLRIQQALPEATFVPGELVLDPVRMRKSRYEIDQLRAASEAADAVFEALIEMPLKGRSEKEILVDIHRLLLEKGHESVGGGIVGIGENGASPHHHVGDRRAQRGDAVVVDFGGVRNNYRSDLTRTFSLGEPTDEFRRVYDIVNEANQKAFKAVRPGVPAEEIDRAARDHITAAGFGEAFLHRTGHGIGLDGHEPPYLVAGNKLPLEEGMTFSIEPGIYLAEKFGVRIEDIVVVTADGADRFNRSTHALQTVE
ncbi:MAG TPA: aminopeptidase P family protein [Chloroflexi bacterium]|nr:aminopeptidase P family protein [Chloroflexota bacterium]